MSILRGSRSPAVLVGLARGVVEAAALAALAVVVEWTETIDVSELVRIAGPLTVLGIRTLEGYIDQIDPSKSRR